MSKNEIQDLKQKFEKIFNSFIHLLKLYVNSIVAFKYESGLCTNIIIGIDSYTNFCINISSEEIHFYFYKYIDTFIIHLKEIIVKCMNLIKFIQILISLDIYMLIKMKHIG